MNPEPKQVNIKEMSVEELYKLALEQQKQITQLVAQLNQAQMNVAAIEAEIAGRSTPPAS
jgi:peptidoglycan hydrolase CwlO-like protein